MRPSLIAIQFDAAQPPLDVLVAVLAEKSPTRCDAAGVVDPALEIEELRSSI